MQSLIKVLFIMSFGHIMSCIVSLINKSMLSFVGGMADKQRKWPHGTAASRWRSQWSPWPQAWFKSQEDWEHIPFISCKRKEQGQPGKMTDFFPLHTDTVIDSLKSPMSAQISDHQSMLYQCIEKVYHLITFFSKTRSLVNWLGFLFFRMVSNISMY